jgi:hypothetical protein
MQRRLFVEEDTKNIDIISSEVFRNTFDFVGSNTAKLWPAAWDGDITEYGDITECNTRLILSSVELRSLLLALAIKHKDLVEGAIKNLLPGWDMDTTAANEERSKSRSHRFKS